MITGKKLKEIREELNMSMAVMASELGFSKTYLVRIESGEYDVPKEMVNKLQNILKKKLKFLKKELYRTDS